MLYVPPHQAPRFEPPDIPVVETISNGGLFLAATIETFKVENPVRLEAALRIGRAARHLNIGDGTVPEKP